MPDWEVFARGSVASQPVLGVTLRANGSFILNEAAHLALGSPAFVELLFDREQQRIGIRAAAKESPNAYPCRREARNGATHTISGAAFCTYYGIDRKTLAGRFAAMLDDQVLVVDLRQPSQPVRAGRARGESPHRKAPQ